MISVNPVREVSFVTWRTEDGMIFLTPVKETLELLSSGTTFELQKYLIDRIENMKQQERKLIDFEFYIKRLQREGIIIE